MPNLVFPPYFLNYAHHVTTLLHRNRPNVVAYWPEVLEDLEPELNHLHSLYIAPFESAIREAAYFMSLGVDMISDEHNVFHILPTGSSWLFSRKKSTFMEAVKKLRPMQKSILRAYHSSLSYPDVNRWETHSTFHFLRLRSLSKLLKHIASPETKNDFAILLLNLFLQYSSFFPRNANFRRELASGHRSIRLVVLDALSTEFLLPFSRALDSVYPLVVETPLLDSKKLYPFHMVRVEFEHPHHIFHFVYVLSVEMRS